MLFTNLSKTNIFKIRSFSILYEDSSLLLVTETLFLLLLSYFLICCLLFFSLLLLLNLLRIRIRNRINRFKKTGGLKLDHNFLSGTVPSEFSRLKKLTSLSLYSNDLSGSIPNSVCETFNTTYPEFEADCIDFDDDCACCTSCCVEDTCVCRYLGTPQEFLCYNQ
jgi:hypothetical protein